MGGCGINGQKESEEEETGKGGGRGKLPAVSLFPGGEGFTKGKGHAE